MTYKLTHTTTIIRTADGAAIPSDPANRDYAEYQMWLANGNEPEAADPVLVVFPSLSPRQIRQALTRAGLRDAVEAAVAAGDQDTKDWWEFSTAFERNHPEVLAMCDALKVGTSAVDALWALGATL